MSERFYINCPLQAGLIHLEGPEAHHLAVVCRLCPGDLLCLFNGDGQEYPARLVEVKRREVVVEVMAVDRPERELGYPLVVACPLPRGDRAQFLLEKLTEIGVTAFVPLASARSVVHPREGRLEKLQRYVIEASKQCGRNVLLRVEGLANWVTFCKQPHLPSLKIVAQPGAEGLKSLVPAISAAAAFTLAFGPEGGFTPEEIDEARAAGWSRVDLGPRILRIETAALVLTSWVVAWKSQPLVPHNREDVNLAGMDGTR